MYTMYNAHKTYWVNGIKFENYFSDSVEAFLFFQSISMYYNGVTLISSVVLCNKIFKNKKKLSLR